MRKSITSAGIAALLLAQAVVAVVAPNVRADTPDCEWTTFGHDLGRSFAAPESCSGINATNVTTLQPKGSGFFNTNAPVTAQPVEKDGVLYVGASDGIFYAIDAATMTKKWSFTVEDPNANDFGKIPASATIAEIDGSTVVVFAGVATLYVLDTAGNLLAARCFDPQHVNTDGLTGPDGSRPPNHPDACDSANTHGKPVEIESSPAVITHGRTAQIVVGMDYNEASDMGPAGLVSLGLVKDAAGRWHLDPQWKYDPEQRTTYHASSGTTPVNPLTVNEGVGAGCGNVWSSPAVDVTRDLAIFGVGNCGSNALTEAIVGVHLTNGGEAFRYAPRQADAGATDPDTDFGATPNVLASGLVGEGGKDGHYYAVDPSSTPPGHLAWSGDAAMPSDLGGIIGSTAVGKAKGKPAVFASSAIPFSTIDPFGTQPGRPLQPTGLHAISADGDTAGTVLWDAPALPAYGAVVYVGGVVFLPDTFAFSMQAYSADTGLLLWSVPVGSAPASPPAVIGDSIYFGSGVPEQGTPLGSVGGVWGYQLPSLG